jgi:hypothetical protein
MRKAKKLPLIHADNTDKEKIQKIGQQLPQSINSIRQ